jgi:hypothetical protein
MELITPLERLLDRGLSAGEVYDRARWAWDNDHAWAHRIDTTIALKEHWDELVAEAGPPNAVFVENINSALQAEAQAAAAGLEAQHCSLNEVAACR